MKVVKQEEGQSVVMVVLILVVLIALVALVVDIGNAYAQRRIVQNAADAGAMSATRELARGTQETTNRQVLAKAKEYVELNGVNPDTVTARYFSFDPDTRTTTDLGTVPNTATRPPDEADGVTVSAGKAFNTYLASVIGHDLLAASAESYGQISRGICEAGEGEGLFPIAFSEDLFDNEYDNGFPRVGVEYTIWDKDNPTTRPGNFGWLSWYNDPSNTELVSNMHDTSRSGRWSISDDPIIPGGPGVQNSSDVKAELNVRIADSDPTRPAEVWIPIYNVTEEQGNSAKYNIVGFAYVRLTGYSFQGAYKYVTAEFLSGNYPVSEGGCMDFGTTSVKVRPPIDLTRNIAGNVAFEYLKIEQSTGQTTYPVDVVNVIDVSGSMNDYWGSGGDWQPKIATAREVLIEFNDMLRPELGDRVGLAKYPVPLPDGSTYRRSCDGYRTRERVGAEIVQHLTDDIGAVNGQISNLYANGWTPLAAAMDRGLAAVLDPEWHVEDHIPIIILASDGMGNVRLDGKMTGWTGRDPTEPACNTPASADAIDMANSAKAAGVTVFAVGIGDFLTYVLQAMATPDSDPDYPHFLQASNPTAMQQIYDGLGERIINFDGECTTVPEDRAANQALVTLYQDGSQIGQTYADDAGNFNFNEVEPGTYNLSATVTRDGITYDVLTNKIGGIELDSLPELVVGQASGTYSIHLALKTANPPQCGGL